MSRSGYSYAGSDWELIKYRGQVASATRGKRGQKLLKDMLLALDAMPQKRLIVGDMVFDGSPQHPDPCPEEDVIVGADQLVDGRGNIVHVGDCCALGALALSRRMDVKGIDPHEPDQVSDAFDVAEQLAREIVYINDEDGPYSGGETPEQRWVRVRAWVASQIRADG